MSKSHLNEEQGEHSRKKTECTRSGAKREHCMFEELQLHVARMGNKMSLEPRTTSHFGGSSRYCSKAGLRKGRGIW